MNNVCSQEEQLFDWGFFPFSTQEVYNKTPRSFFLRPLPFATQPAMYVFVFCSFIVSLLFDEIVSGFEAII